MGNENRPLRVREAAAQLGLSQHTVRAMIARRKLGYFRLGRAIRIPAAEVQRVLAAALVPAVRERGGHQREAEL